MAIGLFSSAQYLEIGARGGMSNYIGDVAPMVPVLSETRLSTGLNASFNINPQIAIRGDYNSYNLSGWDANLDLDWSEILDLVFATKMKEYGVKIIYYIKPYDMCERGWSPYVLAGFSYITYNGVSTGPYGGSQGGGAVSGSSFGIPVGVGAKYMIMNNIALGSEINVAKSFTDQLDYAVVIGDPSTNDWYLFAGATLSYVVGNCYSNKRPRKYGKFTDCKKF